jgi:hypothetical protein
MKNLQKNIKEILPANSTKKYVQNFFSVLQEEFVCVTFSVYVYVQKKGFFCFC